MSNLKYAIIAVLTILAVPSYSEFSISAVKNVGTPVNSAEDEFAPSLTSDGKTMVFNSRRGAQYQDIYICYLNNSRWSDPQPVASINSSFNDESPYITPDGEYIFFSSDRDGSYEMPADAYGRVKVSFDIYVSKKVNNKFDTPLKLPGNVNTIHHERSPSMSPDLKHLFYTAWPFGDVQKAKIMFAEYKDGEFVNAAALPAPVNTGSQDAGLVVSNDGLGFFFSSRRSGGYGGWDIYFVLYDGSSFGNPVNLGPAINSPSNEINLSVCGNNVFFCSNRDGGYGKYDIYFAEISSGTVKIKVRDGKTGKPVETEINIMQKLKDEESGTITYENRMKTDGSGNLEMKPRSGCKDIIIVIEKEGYLPHIRQFNPENERDILIDLDSPERNSIFEINSIYFDYQSARIKPESYPYLDALAAYMKKNSLIEFEITGHTDLHGTDEFNNKLSLGRAEAVKNYIVGKGIEAARLITKGAGKTRPKINSINPEADEKNRRTEFRIIGK